MNRAKHAQGGDASVKDRNVAKAPCIWLLDRARFGQILDHVHSIDSCSGVLSATHLCHSLV